MSTKPVLERRNESACDLCGLPLPSSPVVSAEGKRYCCHGCSHVDAILTTVGTDSEHGRKALMAARARGLISASGESRKPTATLPEDVRDEARLQLSQLACPSCAWLVEAVLLTSKGVAEAEVDYYSDTARVVFDISKTDLDSIIQAVEDSGYGASRLGEQRSWRERMDVIRMGVAFFLAMNQMMLAWVGYGVIDAGGGGNRWQWLVPVLQLVMAVPVITWCAAPIYKRALAALRSRKVVMETLLSLGITAAAGISIVAFVLGQENMYFESASMLVALSLAGRWLENWIKHKASGSLTDLLNFSPTKARDTAGRFQPLAFFTPGKQIVVEENESVPLDVTVETPVTVREGLLTGESHPVKKPAGSTVLAGSIVEKGTLTGRVERTSTESAANRLRERVREALRSADAGSRMADRIAQGFVPLVILVALGAFIWHLYASAGLQFAALTAVAVLVISCPCAFGVAASSALSLAVLRLARNGVLVKDPAALEKAMDLDTVVFDKTGTLTRGELGLEETRWLVPQNQEILQAVQALESQSKHPIGATLARLLPANAALQAEAVVEIPGMGITGEVAGKRYAVGRADLFAKRSRPVPSLTPGVSRIWFGLAGEQPSGWFDISDSLRNEAPAMLEKLKADDIDIELLSGDADATAKAIGHLAGIEKAQGGLMPDDKRRIMENKRSQGRQTAFVGDGFNDAEALAAADVGIAMASGADLALVSAPVVITNNDLRGVTRLLDVARSSVKVLRANFAWAFIYNIALIPVAAAGLLAPMYAALLMALSSASVGLNSLRLRRA